MSCDQFNVVSPGCAVLKNINNKNKDVQEIINNSKIFKKNENSSILTLMRLLKMF